MKEIAAFCDFCTACVDERLRDRLVVGVRGDEARRRMLETAGLTLQTAADICRAAENADISGAAFGSPASSIMKMSEYRRRRNAEKFSGRTSRGPQSGATSVTANNSENIDRCPRCGIAAHDEDQMCPAIGRTCFKCGKKDHFSSVCRGRGRSQSRRRVSSIHVHRSSTVATTDRRLSDVHVRGVTGRPSPRVQLQLHRPDGAVMDTTWTLDTGAET